MTLLDITETVRVDAPPEVVWRLITDVPRHARYGGADGIVRRVTFPGPLRLRPGARWVADEVLAGRHLHETAEIVEIDEGHEFAWVSYPPFAERLRGAGGRAHHRYRLEPDGAGTRVELSLRVVEPARQAWVIRLAYRVYGLAERQHQDLVHTLAGIKETAEHTPRTGFADVPARPAD